MKSRKLVSLILAVMMTVMLFAGCTSQTAQTPSEPQKPAEQPAETPKADKILKFGGTGFGGLFNPIMSDNTYDTYEQTLFLKTCYKRRRRRRFLSLQNGQFQR